MKLNEWITQEVKRYDSEIKDSQKLIAGFQTELKKVQQQKREIGRKNNDNREHHWKIDYSISSIKSSIENMKSKIYACKSSVTEVKKLGKMKPVRLKTGAVVNLKIFDEMLKKLKDKYWTIEYTQYQDGLQIAYINAHTGAKGSFKAYIIPTIPDSIELPLFEKGEIKECSILS